MKIVAHALEVYINYSMGHNIQWYKLYWIGRAVKIVQLSSWNFVKNRIQNIITKYNHWGIQFYQRFAKGMLVLAFSADINMNNIPRKYIQ